MAAIKVGWFGMEDVKDFLSIDRTFYPDENQKTVTENYDAWKRVVDRSLNWEN
jgi:glycerol kinase